MSNTTTSAAVSVHPPAPSPHGRRELPIVFNADGGEYFKIWIVNLLLTIATFGIYSAWAKVRRNRYFYGNTSVNGTSFEYHADPVAILKGRLIAFGAWLVFAVAQRMPPLGLLMLPLIFAAVPFVIMRARKFQLAMTSYRNVRFGFHGTLGGAFRTFILWPIAGAMTFGFLMPRANWAAPKYLFGEASYGDKKVDYVTGVGPFYRLFFSGIGMMFVLALVFAGGAAATDKSVAAMIILALAVGPAYLLLLAYMQANAINLFYNDLELGSLRLRCNMKTLSFAWLQFTNAVLIGCTFGLYTPWATVRKLRFLAESMAVEVTGDLNQFSDGARPRAGSSLGSEAVDLFDMDLGL
jgi:uncharacterized membrane protein YjgN (DUF898 family)